jgi:glycosyltransferase involved in cell wall biosynthesis
MRIAVISNLYPPYVVGGYELACADVIEHLRARGHDVWVLTSRHGVPRQQWDGNVCRALDVELGLITTPQPDRWMRLRGRWLTPHNLRITYRFIQSIQPDVVYIWNLLFAAPLAVLLGATLARRPVVAHLMDYWLAETLNLKPAPNVRRHRQAKALLGRILDRTLRLDELIAMSATLREAHAAAGFSPHRFVVVPHGIDLAKIRVRPAERETPEVRLLSAGQVIPSKGVDVTIAALGRLQSDSTLPPLRLDVIGTGPADYRANLEEQVRQGRLLDVVQFLGYVEHADLLRRYADYDVFVFPTHPIEPGGIVLMEAMAAGLAVLTSDRGGQAEIVTPDHDGLLVPRDPDQIAEALRRLATNPALRRQLQQNARRTAEKNLSILRTADAVEATLFEHATRSPDRSG